MRSAEKKNRTVSVNRKHSGSDQAINNYSLSRHCLNLKNYDWLLRWNINNLLPELWTLPLKPMTFSRNFFNYTSTLSLNYSANTFPAGRTFAWREKKILKVCASKCKADIEVILLTWPDVCDLATGLLHLNVSTNDRPKGQRTTNSTEGSKLILQSGLAT